MKLSEILEAQTVEDKDADGIVKDEYGATPAIGVKRRGKGANKRWGGEDPGVKRIDDRTNWSAASDSA